jgi:hypothetical protein
MEVKKSTVVALLLGVSIALSITHHSISVSSEDQSFELVDSSQSSGVRGDSLVHYEELKVLHVSPLQIKTIIILV